MEFLHALIVENAKNSGKYQHADVRLSWHETYRVQSTPHSNANVFASFFVLHAIDLRMTNDHFSYSYELFNSLSRLCVILGRRLSQRSRIAFWWHCCCQPDFISVPICCRSLAARCFHTINLGQCWWDWQRFCHSFWWYSHQLCTDFITTACHLHHNRERCGSTSLIVYFGFCWPSIFEVDGIKWKSLIITMEQLTDNAGVCGRFLISFDCISGSLAGVVRFTQSIIM